METSSPLASLQPYHAGPFAHPARPLSMSSSFVAACSREPRTFNFKDMSMIKSKSDYFSFNPVRGSSPTASLATDLSQNFHIEESPRLPTPRRNLFNGFAPHDPRASHNVITPPIPSSSPGPESSTMDLSPLPHKPALRLQPASNLGLPTPDPTPVEDCTMRPPPPRQDLLQPPRPQMTQIRRLSAGSRPSLRKGYSVNSVNSRPNGTQALEPAFVFGTAANVSKPLLESFADSPPSERKLPSSNSTSCLLAPAPPFSLVAPESNGSPVGPLRRMSGPRPGSRAGLSRRTQSMQYGLPARPMRAEKRTCTEIGYQPSIDLHEMQALTLPYFKPEGELEQLPRITADTLLEVIDGAHAEKLGEALIIDCRFEYEYEGGHIDGAVNFNDKEQLAARLFSEAPSQPRALIFHCEYSHHRAPIMAKFIRERDRTVNKPHYPRLTYPEVYILDGGYSRFFQNHRGLCFPQNYVEMEASEHQDACEKAMANLKRRGKLHRAQTYAFGQHGPSKDASKPAQPFTNPLPTIDSMDVDFSSPVTLDNNSSMPKWNDIHDSPLAFQGSRPAPPLFGRQDSW